MKLTYQEYKKRGKHGIGSSDAAAILGLTEHPTAVDVYLRLLNGRTYEDNMFTRMGRAVEPVILQELMESTKTTLLIEDSIYLHDKYDYLVARPDALSADRYVEAKMTTHAEAWGDDGTDMVPDYVFAQVQHGMEVVGMDYAVIPVFIMTRWAMEFRVYNVAKSKIIVPQMIEAERDFYENHVLTFTPPEARNLKDIGKIFPHSEAKEIAASEEVFDAVKRLAEVKAEIKDLEKQKDLVELEVKTFMKDADTLRYLNKTIATWKSNTVNRIDVTRFRQEMPDIAKEFTKQSEERRFLVK